MFPQIALAIGVLSSSIGLSGIWCRPRCRLMWIVGGGNYAGFLDSFWDATAFSTGMSMVISNWVITPI